MALTLSGAKPQPTLAWSFDGGLAPYTGTVASTTQRGTLGFTTPGKYNQALNIQNPSGSTSNSINWNFGTQTFSIDNGFSFSLWVRFNDLSYLTSIQQFVTFYNGTSNGLRIQLNANQGLMQYQFNDGVGTQSRNMFTPVAGVWYHLTLVGFAGNIVVYLNGTTTYTPLPYTQSGVTFDNCALGLATSFNGFPVTNADFDDFRIYNTALSAAQALSIYQAQGAPSLAMMTGPTSGSAPVDLAPNPATIPTATVSTSGPFSTEGSLSFSGTGLQVNGSKFPFNWYTGFTVEAWVNYTSFTNAVASSVVPLAMGVMQTAGNIADWALGPNTTGQLRFYYYFTGQNFQLSSNTMSTGTWTHICAQHDGSNFHMYINGVRCVGPVAITGAVALSSTHTYFSFGQYNNSAGPTYKIADVRLVKGSNVYPVTGFTPPTAKLTASPVGTTIFLMQVPISSGSITFSKSV